MKEMERIVAEDLPRGIPASTGWAVVAGNPPGAEAPLLFALSDPSSYLVPLPHSYESWSTPLSVMLDRAARRPRRC